MPQPPVIEIGDLTIRAGRRVILEDARLSIGEGELCLLVGKSGSGKSITLSLMAGIAGRRGLDLRGSARVLGHDVAKDGPAPGTGVVFQDFALFDDWDARRNVAFALDHGAIPETERAHAVEDLLSEFGLRGDQRPARMSGGEKQRLAIARALAQRPRLMLYDEPTSGLDPAMSEAVAGRIRRVHDTHRMTSVVVTHDLVALLPIADRIVLLDPRTRRFVDVPKDDVNRALAELRSASPADDSPPAPATRPGWATAVGRALIATVDATGAFVGDLACTLASLAPRFRKPRWGARFTWGYVLLLVLGSALPFMALAGLIAGFVVSFFLFHLIPYSGFTEPVILEEILGSLGFALHRVVVPGTITLLFAARGGAAIAADIGHRVYTRQMDALSVQRTPPARYLLSAITLAAVFGAPLIWLIAWKCASFAAAVVFLGTHPGQTAFTFSENFPRLLGETILSKHLAWAFGKTLLCFVGTVAIAWGMGNKPKLSGDDLARGVTATIIRTTIFVLCVHLVFAMVEF